MQRGKWKGKHARPIKLSIADEQYLNVTPVKKGEKKSSKELTRDLSDAYGPLVEPSTIHWSLIRNCLGGSGCQEAILKGRKQGEKAEDGQITLELETETENKWQQVIQSDELNWNPLFKLEEVRRVVQQYLLPSVKYSKWEYISKSLENYSW